MTEKNQSNSIYRRKVSPLEGMFFHAPYAIVTMVARIKGRVSEDMLQKAVTKARKRHTNLKVRIEYDESEVPWFTTEDVRNIPILTFTRENNQSWIEIVDQQSRVPFDFEQRPAIRFILVKSPDISELVILCHHMICDGMSLAYLARDILNYLGDPSQPVEILVDPDPIDKNHLPPGVSMNGLVNYFVERINKKWQEERIFFDQHDYQAIAEAYWENFNHKMVLIEFSQEKTTELVEKCKSENVTVNSALAVALASAQIKVQGTRAFHSRTTIAGSLRERLGESVGEGMGFFVGAVSPRYKYKQRLGFWENTRLFHNKAKPLYTNKNLFQDPLVWSYLEPGILESLSFKMIGRLVSRDSNRYMKLSSFSKRDDVIASMIKREKMDSFENVLIGTAVTNLTRMNFPLKYGDLELECLILKPGGAYPLVFVNLLAGAVTCSGVLSLMLEYSEERISTDTVERIRDEMLQLLGVG